MSASDLKAQAAIAAGKGDPMAPVAPAAVPETATPAKQTYIHQVAGANTILPDGQKLTFAGRTALASEGRSAGLGYYTTDIQAEIDWLESLVRVPSSQVTKLLADSSDGREKVMYKQEDPAIQAAFKDAAKNSENQANPAISAAADNLGTAIAVAAAGNQ